jgi:hypothetical protein
MWRITAAWAHMPAVLQHIHDERGTSPTCLGAASAASVMCYMQHDALCTLTFWSQTVARVPLHPAVQPLAVDLQRRQTMSLLILVDPATGSAMSSMYIGQDAVVSHVVSVEP